jgi:hypothetical protein
VQEEVHAVCDGLTPEQVTARPGPDANTVGWLIWHLTRVQDDHVADAAGLEQVWTTGEWSEWFGLPFPPGATGYGQSPDEVGAVVASAELLTGYYDAVHAQTLDYLKGLTEPDLDRVVDTRWNPPVTLGVRLISVVSDDLQHIGQAAYVRGLLR